MKYVKTPSSILFVLLVLSMGLVGVARADEYAETLQLLRTGRLADAQTKTDAFLAAKPRDPQMRFLKGVIQRDSGKVNEAIATFNKLTEDYPELPEPYNNLAVLQAAAGKIDAARELLETALRLDPGYRTAQENLGDVFARLAQRAYEAAAGPRAEAGLQGKLRMARELAQLR